MEKEIVANSVKDTMFLQVISHIADFTDDPSKKAFLEKYFDKFNSHKDFCKWILSIIFLEKELLEKINSKKTVGEANLRNLYDLKTYFLEKDNILNRKSDAEPYIKLLNLTYNTNKGHITNSTIKTLMELTDRIVKINIDNQLSTENADIITQKLSKLKND